MKKITTAMATAMLMGATMTADAGAPLPPYKTALGSATHPNLFVQEKVAFALLEGAMQVAEGLIFTKGCTAAAAKYPWDINVEVFEDGKGGLDISSNGVSQGTLYGAAFSTNSKYVAPAGTTVKVGGSAYLLGNITVPYNSTAYYNDPGAMMVQSATFPTKSVNLVLDQLSGTVIKDFWKQTYGQLPVIIDWGLQSVSKNLVPQDKWWQRSYAWRSDGVFGRTHFRKDRLYSAKNGGACSIDIDISGSNDADYFGQSGTLTIRKAAPSPTF